MHSILSTFFSGPVTGEEKKKRLAERLACEFTVHVLYAKLLTILCL